MSSEQPPDGRETFVAYLSLGLAERLKDEDGADFNVVDGPVEGPQSEADLACVWWEGVRPHPRAGIVSTDFYRVRLFKRWRQEQGGHELRGTVNGHLRRLAGELELVLRALQISEGHDYYVVTEVTPDYVQQCVNAQLTAVDRNRSTQGG